LACANRVVAPRSKLAFAAWSGLDLSTVREALGGLLAAGLAEPDAGGYRVGVTLRGRRQRGPVAAEATRAHDRGAGA